MTNEKTEANKLKNMASALEELHLSLEPVRDKALDQKAFYTGYSQCAEQMIKVIISKMNYLREQAKLEETNVVVEEPISVEEQVEEMEAPLVVDPEPKTRKKKKTQEIQED